MKFPNILTALDFRGATQNDLASALRTSPASISRKLDGHHDFSPSERSRIAEALQFNREWLFTPVPIPREAMRPEAENLGVSFRKDTRDENRPWSNPWPDHPEFATLPLQFLRQFSWLRHSVIPFTRTPFDWLSRIRDEHGAETYLLACSFLIHTLRCRFSCKPGYSVAFSWNDDGTVFPGPSRTGADCLLDVARGSVVHPKKMEEK